MISRMRMALSATLLLSGSLLTSYAKNCAHPQRELYAAAADYAHMANEVYNANGGTPPPGWLGPGDWGNAANQMNAHNSGLLGSGMQYAAYKNPETGEIVISFRGTEAPLDSPADVGADIALGLGLTSAQHHEALAAALRIKHENPGAKITITGHSLGGSLATHVAHRLSVEAVTFNPAQVGLSTLFDNEVATWGGASGDQITNFVHEDDPLWNYLRPLPTGMNLGTDVLLTNHGDYAPAEGTSAHSVINFVNHFQHYKDCIKKEQEEAAAAAAAAAGTASAGGAPGAGPGTAGLMPPSSPPTGGGGGAVGKLKPFR